MAIADRKERALRERELLILEQADDLLRLHGYLGLNLDELAERIEYSKATIYNHYQSKEDLILGVVIMHLQTRIEFFNRALTFEGHSRERMFAVGIADQILAQLYPHGFSLMQLSQTQSLWEKAAPERQAAFFAVSGGCMVVPSEIIRQARAGGDLDGSSPSDEHILTGLLSLAKGAHLLGDGEKYFPEDAGLRPLTTLNDNFQVFLDGAHWKPLRTELDYKATEQRILDQCFADETKRAAKRWKN